MFHPTHLLVSRSRKTPVQLVPSSSGLMLLTETEFQAGTDAAFEMRPRLGIFCKGVPLVGYSLQPLPTPVSVAPASAAGQSR
ncbi:MAG: hypothetical protein Fur0046_39900 [Cyanobacteria bacterium J069]|nr:MAG: hypothetical protein D6742_07340 [Cyanobacteria bacterium J069]